jgi:hypothetical protein
MHTLVPLVCAALANAHQGAVEKLHQQLSRVGQPHSLLLKQLSAAEAAAVAAEAQVGQLKDALAARDAQTGQVSAERAALRRDLERLLRERGTLDSLRRMVSAAMAPAAAAEVCVVTLVVGRTWLASAGAWRVRAGGWVRACASSLTPGHRLLLCVGVCTHRVRALVTSLLPAIKRGRRFRRPSSARRDACPPPPALQHALDV